MADNNLIPHKQALMEYKILSQIECLYILLYLVKHRMGGYKQINEGYKQWVNDTSDHTPIKDHHVKEVISQGWVKVNKLGVLSLDKNVDNISDLLVRIDWFNGSVPRMYNYENAGEFYITNDWKKVYTVRNYRGHNQGQFKTLRPAIDLKNNLNTNAAALKLKETANPTTALVEDSEIVADDFGKKTDRLGAKSTAIARRKRKSEQLKEKKKLAKQKEREKKKKEAKKKRQTALDYLKKLKNSNGLALINYNAIDNTK